MGQLMSSLAHPINNVHESNAVYNYRFPTSVSNYFNDNYFFCGYKFKKSSLDKLIFEGEKHMNDMEIFNYLPFLPLSFAAERVKPISFNIYSYRNSFEISQQNETNKYKLQFLFDADCSCKIDIFHHAIEQFIDGKLTYSLKSVVGYKNTSIHPSGPSQLFEHEFTYLQIHNNLEDSSESGIIIPFVVLLSTFNESKVKDQQQFVTILHSDLRSDSHVFTGFQVTVQKLVYNNTIFVIQDMYGADPFTDLNEQDILNNQSTRSSNNDIKNEYLNLDRKCSISKSKLDDRRKNVIQDCVICMASVRDTLVLPCRHLCLCSSCGEKLLHQSPSCPICRSTFRALLQIENFDKFLGNPMNE